MKCAAILTVAMVMLMSQRAECLLGNILGGAGGVLGGAGGGGLLSGNGGLLASVTAILDVEVVLQLTASATAGTLNMAQLQVILNLLADLNVDLDVDLLANVFAFVDLDVDGFISVTELPNLLVELTVKGILSGAGGPLGSLG